VVLVTARALQGAFGAVLAPSALGTLVSTFNDPRERGRAFGVFGSVASGGGAVGLILGGVLTEYLSWRWCLYVNLAIAAIAVFVVTEQRVRHPLLPLRVIVDRARGGAYVAVGISGMALFGTFLFLTFYLQVVEGNTPLTTGLLFLPMIGSILISSNLSSNIGLGPRALIAAGMLLGAGGLVVLTQVTVTSSYVSDVLPGLLILGLGFGLIF